MSAVLFRRSWPLALVPLAIVASVSSRAHAQQGQLSRAVAADTRPVMNPPSAAETFARPVTVSLESVSLARALNAIAASAAVRIQFRAEQLDAIREPVTLRVTDLPLGAALTRVLAGTNLQAISSVPDVVTIKLIAAAPARQGTIVGTVTNGETKRPIAGATVLLDGATKGVVTSDDGSFRLPASVGTHTIVVRAVGFARQTRTVTIGENEAGTLAIVLAPSASVLNEVVVTGTVVATERKAIPNAISVITAKDIEQRGITRIDQLFRGDVPGLYAMNLGVFSAIDSVAMFSRGATSAPLSSYNAATSTIKTYVDGVEMANSSYLSQIDPRSIERIEILSGPQASTIYGSNAINGVMQIFTKRGGSVRPQWSLTAISGLIQNSMTASFAPQHDLSSQVTGTDGRWSYNLGGSWLRIGEWTPAKQTTVSSVFGGAKSRWGALTMDASMRSALTNTRGSELNSQYWQERIGTGLFNPASFGWSFSTKTSALRGQTVGINATYAPVSWWTTDAGYGADVSTVDIITTVPGYTSPYDTLASMSESRMRRSSLRIASTVRTPVTSHAQLLVTVGGDQWTALSRSSDARGVSLTGRITMPGSQSRIPGHNAGAFLQAQFGVLESVFFTYGLRGEWNPNYGADAVPNLAPRYGVSYTRDVGAVSAKVRASYGRSTRPPAIDQKKAVLATSASQLSTYGPFATTLANPELGPEFQQGGEGGLELYFGNRGSLVITRYNQTVEGLIVSPLVDSVRSLTTSPLTYTSRDVDGYGYYPQSQFINIGSLRNQGWELQGSLSLGPITTRGTYSWTKSRMMSIDARYRNQFPQSSYPMFQPGVPVGMLPEHTWAFGATYARGATSVGVAANGSGFLYIYRDMLDNTVGLYRLNMYSPRRSYPSGYRPMGPGVTMADLNATHRLSSHVELVLQVQNLADAYRNDVSTAYASIGRQSKAGARLRF